MTESKYSKKYLKDNQILGCGKEFRMNTSFGFICGIPNGNSQERFCDACKLKLRAKWAADDFEISCRCGMNIPKGFGFYNYGIPFKCPNCGQLNVRNLKFISGGDKRTQ